MQPILNYIQSIIIDYLEKSHPSISFNFNIPEIYELLNSKVQVRKQIPKMCRNLFAVALTTLFRSISQKHIVLNFRLLTLFP